MKQLFKWSFLFLISLLISCSESGPNDPDESVEYQSQLAKLFPYNDNKTYEYNVDTLNSSMNEFERVSKRTFNIYRTEKLNDYLYYSGSQKYNYSTEEIILNTKFRFSEKSLLLLSDTSNATQGFPEELLSNITIYFDPEINLLELPLEINKPWPVFKVTIDFQTFKFNTVDVVGEYLGKESLVLDGFTNSFETEKVLYTLDVHFPDLENPFISETETYYSTIWFAENYGIIKMEGCSLLLSPVAGSNVNFADRFSVSRHILTKVNE